MCVRHNVWQRSATFQCVAAGSHIPSHGKQFQTLRSLRAQRAQLRRPTGCVWTHHFDGVHLGVPTLVLSDARSGPNAGREKRKSESLHSGGGGITRKTPSHRSK